MNKTFKKPKYKRYTKLPKNIAQNVAQFIISLSLQQIIEMI